MYTDLRRTQKTLSVLAESHRALAESYRSLLEENEAKDKTIKSFEQKDLEQQQEIKDLRRERDWQPNDWDNDGSSNADCHDRLYSAERVESW
ncbi:hypothetical protein [Microcoleus sp. Aus8_D3]|uniref:hypothetical protein n=1 Tax=Microcoleus sp. Aus8_D3 TaxID=2818633 RepID=UPI002FCEC34A